MAAGQGFKTFTTGEVLTAGDVNGYLMQGVLVFASTAARDAAITSPQEGQFAYTKDTNGLWYYDGAAWVASGATGDIEGVTAGTGISGGGTSGTVTITNSMATAIDAKGDLVVGTGADTFSKLTVGANATVLTADSAQATGMKWAAVSGGGSSWSLFNSGGTALSGNTTTVSGISGVDKILVVVSNYGSDTASDQPYFRFNSNSGSVYRNFGGIVSASSVSYGINQVYDNLSSITKIICANGNADQTAMFATSLLITGANSSGFKQTSLMGGVAPGGTSNFAQARYAQGIFEDTATISSVTIGLNSGTFDSGSIFIYTSVS
jgi:hypothetical protein